jgi:hypothetical protein
MEQDRLITGPVPGLQSDREGDMKRHVATCRKGICVAHVVEPLSGGLGVNVVLT